MAYSKYFGPQIFWRGVFSPTSSPLCFLLHLSPSSITLSKSSHKNAIVLALTHHLMEFIIALLG